MTAVPFLYANSLSLLMLSALKTLMPAERKSYYPYNKVKLVWTKLLAEVTGIDSVAFASARASDTNGVGKYYGGVSSYCR